MLMQVKVVPGPVQLGVAYQGKIVVLRPFLLN